MSVQRGSREASVAGDRAVEEGESGEVCRAKAPVPTLSERVS